VLAGAWGARAGELLERAGERRGVPIHRVDELAMSRPPQLVAGDWCCWLFGQPEDRGALAARYGLQASGDLPAAFAAALTELGEAACELLCGRFVVVALDRERGRCWVTRDQLGAQPLVHARVDDGVLFAEHERELLELLPQAPSPDRLALLQWIENGLTVCGRTLYEGMQRLAAGHRLMLEQRSVRVERWWDIHYQGVDEENPRALGEWLREEAFAAIDRASAGAEHPVVKLSGGLDSACVAAGLAANGFADGRGLAIGGTFSSDPDADESALIYETARHTDLPLELVAFDPASSMLAPALAHIARWRLPPGTPNLFLWQPVMARARELGVDRMLDGEGGDELFGLAPYLIADMVRKGRLATAWSLSGQIPGIGLDPSAQIRLRVLRHYGLSPLLPTAVRRRRRRQARARTATSANAFVAPADAQALGELQIADELDRRDGPTWWRLQAESLIDMRDSLDMGAHFRREAADAAIDVRHPLLYDIRLVEAALRLAPRAQFDPIRDRPLLREALSGLIPETVRTRHEKSHFSALVMAGIRADEAGLIDPLRRSAAPVRAYVAASALDRRIEVQPDQRPLLGAGTLWRVAIANRWLASQQGEGR
jgi:asparagine synthase (glutamine-hydrolysing)